MNKIKRLITPTKTWVAGMVSLALVEMIVPVTASVIVGLGSKIKGVFSK